MTRAVNVHGGHSGWKMLIRCLVLLLSCGLVVGSASRSTAADNPIVLENQQPGTDQWQLWRSGYQTAGDVDKQIKGYASATSVNKGESITFYVTVNPAQSFTTWQAMHTGKDTPGAPLQGQVTSVQHIALQPRYCIFDVRDRLGSDRWRNQQA